MDDIDLNGLSAADAKAYVLEFMTALKAAERELGVIDSDLALWIKRVALATEKGAADLVAAAQARVEEIRAKRNGLEAERAELAAKVSRMRERLPMVGASERGVDPDLLLAQLQMATGEAMGGPSPAMESGLASLGADDALAALKRKLTGGAGTPAEPAPPAETPAQPPADDPKEN